MSSSLTIYLHETMNDEPQTIEVQPFDPICTLLGENKLYIHNNVMLSPMFSFNFMKINNGDHIYAFNSPKKRTPHKIPITALLDVDDIKDERARIADCFVSRVEGSAVCYRRLIRRYKQSLADDETESFKQKESDLSTGNGPSTDALPMIWE